MVVELPWLGNRLYNAAEQRLRLELSDWYMDHQYTTLLSTWNPGRTILANLGKVLGLPGEQVAGQNPVLSEQWLLTMIEDVQNHCP